MNRKRRIDAVNGIVYGLLGSPCINKCAAGYIQVYVGGNRKEYAHRLIWESVHGAIPKGLEINHKNGIKTDNRISNLELVTHIENLRHAYVTGLSDGNGEANSNARLKISDVDFIRANHDRISQERLARRFGVSRRCVRDIIKGRNWKSIAVRRAG